MKKIVSCLLVLTMLLSMLAVVTAQAEEPITLRFMWWGGDARHEATLKVIEQYMAAHPNVTIEGEYGSDDGYYQKLITQLSAGTEADIIQMVPEWFSVIHGDGSVFVDLDDGAIDISGFDSLYLEANCSVNGHVQALPTGLGGQIMAVNNDFLERFGIPTDTVWTWENLLEYGKQVHEQDPECYLLGGFGSDDGTPTGIVPKFHAMQQVCTGAWVNDDWTLGFTEESLTKTYEYYVELLASNVMQPVDEMMVASAPLENSRWINGQIGMMHAMTSTIATFAVEGMSMSMVRCPVFENGTDPCNGASPSQLLGISARCAHPEVAKDFLNYFYNSEEAVLTLGTVRGSQPTGKGNEILANAGLLDQELASVMADLIENGTQFFSMVSVRQEFNVPFTDITNEVLFGATTPAEGAKRMVDEYNSAIAVIKESAQ